MAGKEEKRVYERYSLSLPVELEYEHHEYDNIELTKLINLSAGGAYFSMGIDPGIDNSINMNIAAGSLLGGEADEVSRVKASGVVKRVENRPDLSDRYFVAVEFDGPVRIIQA